MKQRPLGITALSVASVAVALYGMVAGIALLMGGAIGTFGRSDAGIPVLVLGAIIFGAGMAAFFVGYGFWLEKHWSWAGGIVIFSVMIAGIVAMGLIGASFTSLILPIALGGGAIWYLLRPDTKRALLGEPEARPERPPSVQSASPESTDVRVETAV